MIYSIKQKIKNSKFLNYDEWRTFSGFDFDSLSTGIHALDTELLGGIPRSSMCVVIGPADGCISLFLIHLAANVLRSGLNVFYASLNTPAQNVLVGLYSNLSGIPKNILLDGSMTDECVKRVSGLNIGRCCVADFQRASVVENVLSGVRSEEGRLGRPFDVLFVDQADLLSYPRGRAYEGMGEIYRALRSDFASRHRAWVWTGAMARRRRRRPARLALEDVADSMRKVWYADVCVTLQFLEGRNLAECGIVKNRHGPTGGIVKFLTELECSRIAPVHDEDYL